MGSSAFDQLFSDPGFQTGMSILGNTGTPGVVGQALANMANINRMKAEAQTQARNAETEARRQQSTAGYEQGLLSNANRGLDITENQFARQNALTAAQLNQMYRQQAMQNGLLQSFGSKFGLQIPNLPVQPSPYAGMDAGLPNSGNQAQGLKMPVAPGGAPGDGTLPPGTPQGQYGQPGMLPDYTVDQNGTPHARLPNGGALGPMPQYAPSPQAPAWQVPNFNPDNPADQGGPMTENGRMGNQGFAPSSQGGNRRHMMKTGFGQFGTPNSILDGVEHVESGGNALAVNRQSGALGAYQFMPQTVQMLAQQGMQFNPFDKGQARNAADFYLAQLARANGGDWHRALAQYGGFKTQDPTSYVQRVLSGVNMPPAMQSGMQGPPMANPGIDVAQMGALMSMAGIPGGSEFAQLGGLMKPENVPAGSYQRDPTTGQTQFYGNPYEEQKIGQEQQKIGLQAMETGANVAKAQSTLTNEQIARNKEYIGDQDALYKTTNWANNLKNSIDQMVQFDQNGNIKALAPGFDQMTGATGAVMRHIPGTAAYNMHEKLESLLNQTKFEVVNQMKNAAGQTGLGRVLQSEFQAMGESLAPLDPNMSTEALAKSLYKIRSEADKLSTHASSSFAQRYGALPGQPQTDIPRATPGAPPTGVYSAPQPSAFAPQDVPAVTKTVNGVTYRKTGPTSWERQ